MRLVFYALFFVFRSFGIAQPLPPEPLGAKLEIPSDLSIPLLAPAEGGTAVLATVESGDLLLRTITAAGEVEAGP